MSTYLDRRGLLEAVTVILLLLLGTLMPLHPASVRAAVATYASSPLLLPGQVLTTGQTRSTVNGQVRLEMQANGDLVVRSQGDLVWRSQTTGYDGASAYMQADGNVVLRDVDGKARWNSGTAGHPGAYLTVNVDGLLLVKVALVTIWTNRTFNSTITSGHFLRSGWSLTAAGGRVVTTMQGDGNLVTRRNGAAVWASGTWGHAGAYAVMQSDGNFLVRAPDLKPLWISHTQGYPGAKAIVQADSYFVIYSSVGAPLWWRDVGQGATLCRSTAPDPNGTPVTRWHPVELCVLTVLRLPASNLSDVDILIEYESGGDPNAINLWDSNAIAGHPSKGLIQVIQSTFTRFRSVQLSEDLFNPAANLYAGLNYATYTYGSIHNAPGLVSLRSGGRYKGYVLHA